MNFVHSIFTFIEQNVGYPFVSQSFSYLFIQKQFLTLGKTDEALFLEDCFVCLLCLLCKFLPSDQNKRDGLVQRNPTSWPTDVYSECGERSKLCNHWKSIYVFSFHRKWRQTWNRILMKKADIWFNNKTILWFISCVQYSFELFGNVKTFPVPVKSCMHLFSAFQTSFFVFFM